MWRNVKGSDGCMGYDGQQQGSTRRGVYSTTAAACIFLTLRPGWKSLCALQSLSVAELWEGIMFRDTLFMCAYQAYRGHEIANWSKQILLLYFFMLWLPNSRGFFLNCCCVSLYQFVAELWFPCLCGRRILRCTRASIFTQKCPTGDSNPRTELGWWAVTILLVKICYGK